MTDNLYLETMAEFIRLRTSLERLVSPITADYGLTPVQSVTLHLISRSTDATVGGIIKQMNFNQGNVSSVCKKLESDGFISRSKSTGDERRYVISLTPKGEDALRGIESVMPSVLPRCTPEENEAFRRALDAVASLKSTLHRLNCEINKNNIGDDINA